MPGPTKNDKSIKEYNKINKYEDLEIEIGKMWLLKTTVVPVIVGALSLSKSINHIINECNKLAQKEYKTG